MKHQSFVLNRFLLASLLSAAALVACSSSSTPNVVGTADAGHDAHKTDAKATADTGAQQDVGPIHDAGIDVGNYPGIDAALSNFGVSSACRLCVEAHCPSQTEACLNANGIEAGTRSCKQIEQCALTCVAANVLSPSVCAATCIQGDASVPDGATFMPDTAAEMAAETLDVCFGIVCGGDCT
jgi:hypothetical protein